MKRVPGVVISNILLLGLVSMLIDMSAEMVYPLIPLYLTTVMGVSPMIVGIIEGVAESLASLLKMVSGYIADKYRNKKQLTFIGYSGAIVYKLALIFATGWSGILGARILDRIGKGIRTAPRDALIAESSAERKLGSSYGLHKMLDMLGSALGILIAYFLVIGEKVEYKSIFLVSIIPAVLGVAAISLVREQKTEVKLAQKLDLHFGRLDSRLKAFLIIIFIFTLGNSSNAFLLLRAQDTGYDPKTVILLYFLFNIVASVLAWPLGRLSDRLGRRLLLMMGYALYGIVYIGFAVLASKSGMVVLFALYGLYTALTVGAERALVAEISPPELRGTMLGLYATLTGIALLPASVIAGLLWNLFGASAPFWFGGTLGLLAAFAVAIVLRRGTHFVSH